MGSLVGKKDPYVGGGKYASGRTTSTRSLALPSGAIGGGSGGGAGSGTGSGAAGTGSIGPIGAPRPQQYQPPQQPQIPNFQKMMESMMSQQTQPQALPPPTPSQMQVNFPQQQQFSSYNQQAPQHQIPQRGQLGQNLEMMRGVSEGFLDPDSDYFKRLMEGMQEEMGQGGAAQQRSAALRGAYGGFGGGQSAQSMQSAADIGMATQEAVGTAGANLRMQAPQMGMQALQSTFQPELGFQQLQEQAGQFGQNLGLNYQQMGEQSRQFGAGLQEQGRQAGINTGMQAQQMAQQAAQQQWQMQQQQAMQQAQQQQQILQMMAGMFG